MTLGDCEVVYCVYDAKVVVIDYPGGVDEKKVFRSSLPSFKPQHA